MSMFRAPYSAAQRWQLNQLAEVDGLTLDGYQKCRERILNGEVVFEREIVEAGASKLYRKYKSRQAHQQDALEFLEGNGPSTTKRIAMGIDMEANYCVRVVLNELFAQGCIRKNDHLGSGYVWCLPQHEWRHDD